MPLFEHIPYKPNFLFKNEHLNSIYPALFRNIKGIGYERHRIQTADGDFLDLDYSRIGSSDLVVQCHGLEGSSSSKYMMGMARYMNQKGLDNLSINYRGCSGEMNLKTRMYNSGTTDDIHSVLDRVKGNYDFIFLIGYSLGGNIVLKYLGEQTFDIDHRVKAAIAFSTPCDLTTSINELEKRYMKPYRMKFINSLAAKVKEKHNQFPDSYPLDPLKGMTSLRQFDDMYTAPIGGYADSADYYKKCSSKQFVLNISIPTLLVNALDDPFLSKECMLYDEANESDYFHFYPTVHGGHVGFSSFSKQFWSEQIAYRFIDANR